MPTTKEKIAGLRTEMATAQAEAQAGRASWQKAADIHYAILQHEAMLRDEERAAARPASVQAAQATLDSIAAERAKVVERAARFADQSSGAVVGSPLDVTLFDARHAQTEIAASNALASHAPVAPDAADVEAAQKVRDANAKIVNPIARAAHRVKYETAWDVAQAAPAKAGAT